MEKTIVAELDITGRVLGLYEKDKNDKITPSKLKKISNHSDLFEALAQRLEMAEAFYSPDGPAYNMARRILDAFVLFAYPTSVANHLQQYGYKNTETIHSQMVKSGSEMKVITPDEDIPLPKNLPPDDLLYYVFKNNGIQQKAEKYLENMKVKENMPLYYAVSAYIVDFFISLAENEKTKKYAFILFYHYMDPSNSHKPITQKAEEYAKLYGIAEATYYRHIKTATILFAKSIWGELPAPENNSSLEIVNNRIVFKKPKKFDAGEGHKV